MTKRSANSITEQAAHFLERRDRGPWSAEDQAGLDQWLAQSSKHCAEFWRLEAVWQDTDRLTVLRAFKPQAPRQHKVLPILRRVAATAAIIAVIGAIVLAWTLQPEGEKYATSLGGRQIVTMSDGSQVELNTDTVVRIVPGQRRATVERGEAFFHIKHDDHHPFIVTVGDHRVVDLGTEFVVRHEAGQTRIALIEGLARVEALGENSSVASKDLKPGDVALASLNKISVERESGAKLANQLAWRRGLLIFDYTTLGEAVAEFNRYNQTKLEVADPDIAKQTMIGTFPINDVALFSRVAGLVLKLNVTRNGDRIILSR